MPSLFQDVTPRTLMFCYRHFGPNSIRRSAKPQLASLLQAQIHQIYVCFVTSNIPSNLTALFQTKMSVQTRYNLIHSLTTLTYSLTTLTEVFPCFSSVVRQMPGLNSQSRGTDRISSELSFVLCLSLCYAIVFMLFYYYVVLLLCCSVIICVILCIDRVYCTTATGC